MPNLTESMQKHAAEAAAKAEAQAKAKHEWELAQAEAREKDRIEGIAFMNKCKEAILPIFEVFKTYYLVGAESEISTSFNNSDRYNTVCMNLEWKLYGSGIQYSSFNAPPHQLTMYIYRHSNGYSGYPPFIKDTDYVLTCNEYLSTTKRIEIRKGFFSRAETKVVWDQYVTLQDPDWKEKVEDAFLKTLKLPPIHGT